MHQITTSWIIHYFIIWLWLTLVAKVTNAGYSLKELLFGWFKRFGNFIWLYQSQKTTSNICRTYSSSSFELFESAFAIEISAHINAVGAITRIISVSIILTIILVKDSFWNIVRCLRLYNWNKFTRSNSWYPFLGCQDCFSLDSFDLSSAINSDN